MLDLGAGKTAATLTAIKDLIDDEEIRHALIVAPKRVAELVWRQEAAAWAHTAGLKIALLEGAPAARAALLACASTRQITLIGIDNTQWLVGELEKRPADDRLFDLLVIDEVSRLKSPASKRARALLSIAGRFRNRWGLTGTPRPNGEEDLFMPAAVITAGALWGRSYHRWLQERFKPDFSGFSWTIKPAWKARTEEEFGRISITLDDADMPDIPEINTVVSTVTLPPDVIGPYREMQQQLFTSVEGREVLAANPAVAAGKLAQLVAGFLYDAELKATRLHQVKLDWLQEIIASLDGQPLLVAYEFREDIAALNRMLGTEVPYLGGDVPSAVAERHVEAWNAGRLAVMALHPASAGHGLNLQAGGHHLAWLGLTWSAELYQQTLKRIHRPGQKQRVTVHICLAEGTVDEMKRDRVIDKLSAQEAFQRHLQRI